jgi:hypothetical protein
VPRPSAAAVPCGGRGGDAFPFLARRGCECGEEERAPVLMRTWNPSEVRHRRALGRVGAAKKSCSLSLNPRHGPGRFLPPHAPGVLPGGQRGGAGRLPRLGAGACMKGRRGGAAQWFGAPVCFCAAPQLHQAKLSRPRPRPPRSDHAERGPRPCRSRSEGGGRGGAGCDGALCRGARSERARRGAGHAHPCAAPPHPPLTLSLQKKKKTSPTPTVRRGPVRAHPQVLVPVR